MEEEGITIISEQGVSSQSLGIATKPNKQREKKNRVAKPKFEWTDTLKENYIRKRWSDHWRSEHKKYLNTPKGRASFWKLYMTEFNFENNTTVDAEQCKQLEKNLVRKWNTENRKTSSTGNQDADGLKNLPSWYTLLADAFEVCAYVFAIPSLALYFLMIFIVCTIFICSYEKYL